MNYILLVLLVIVTGLILVLLLLAALVWHYLHLVEGDQVPGTQPLAEDGDWG